MLKVGKLWFSSSILSCYRGSDWKFDSYLDHLKQKQIDEDLDWMDVPYFAIHGWRNWCNIYRNSVPSEGEKYLIHGWSSKTTPSGWADVGPKFHIKKKRLGRS
jgi:hypothetical protein